MKLQLTLALICVLLPQVRTYAICYLCIPDASGTCKEMQTVCADRCGSQTTLVSAGGVQEVSSVKACAVASQCVNGSLNLGHVKMTVHTQCCTTDRCNSQNPAALPFGSPNGKKCYTCTNNDCKGTVNCEGDQDRCIITTVTSGNVQVKAKGCASRSLCAADASSMKAAGVTATESCCKGDMCNSAEGVKLSLLIMLVPLISSTLFH
ncbi:urokinase plasminogen activator surface receptor-like [Colossoma macropomum]|uniref:urokinase plasminogen activator surface receptor-like n=1 Tax=Colossoma macropomum TaxID=42526 RepID=UPI0018650162|nr:urokinase plasminogen activator surface receptor-like [Colossoma macropomum]